MEIENVLKFVASAITGIFALIAAYIELKKDPNHWLNRWFALFYSSMGFGFLTYTIYHLILTNETLVIPIMISAQILFNLSVLSFLMTAFILDYSEKIATTPKYLLIFVAIFSISIFGYFIPGFGKPILNTEKYVDGIVDTDTPIPWLIFVHIWRLVLWGFSLFKYATIAIHTEGTTKTRIFWFLGGSISFVAGMLLNLFGGIFHLALIEIIALLAFNIGMILTVRGFLIK